jgi:hypothetical protein
MLNSEGIYRDIRDPVMIGECLLDCPILASGSLENQGSKILWTGAMKP